MSSATLLTASPPARLAEMRKPDGGHVDHYNKLRQVQ